MKNKNKFTHSRKKPQHPKSQTPSFFSRLGLRPCLSEVRKSQHADNTLVVSTSGLTLLSPHHLLVQPASCKFPTCQSTPGGLERKWPQSWFGIHFFLLPQTTFFVFLFLVFVITINCELTRACLCLEKPRLGRILANLLSFLKE